MKLLTMITCQCILQGNSNSIRNCNLGFHREGDCRANKLAGNESFLPGILPLDRPGKNDEKDLSVSERNEKGIRCVADA